MLRVLSLGNSHVIYEEADELLKERHAYVEPSTPNIAADPVVQYMSKAQMEKSIERTRKLMQEAAKKLEFIEAAQYRVCCNVRSRRFYISKIGRAHV